jgi:hypothetical protein
VGDRIRSVRGLSQLELPCQLDAQSVRALALGINGNPFAAPGPHDDASRSHHPRVLATRHQGRAAAAVGDFFARNKPVGAICHGVLLAARSSFRPGKSVLYGKKTTALTKQMELIAWRLTRLYLGDYYRTYPTTVEDEVRSALARPEDFITGPLPLRRDSAARLGVGFTVRDGEYLSARWPGDAHRFAAEFAAMIG